MGPEHIRNPHIPCGGRMRSSLKLSKGAEGGAELLRCRNTGAFCNISLLEDQGQKSYNIHDTV